MIITPDSSALTGEGAAGCASGNHTCPNGHIPSLIPNPARNSPSASATRPGRFASKVGTCALTESKSYLNSPGPSRALLTARISAPAIVNTQASCIIQRYLFAARRLAGFRCSNRISAYPGSVIICQKMKKNHIMSVVLTSPYMAATNSSRFG
ncbi:MAG: hypothetical protein M5U12_27390 [Verrucomicrobia bacterium]|nr:hypothetical protein [Verrucomicrobiota bacterium]